MNAQTVTTILSVVLGGGFLAALGALFLLPSQRAKLGAEREQVQVASQVSLAGGYGELVDALREYSTALREEITRLRSQLVTARTDNEGARREIHALRADLAEFRTELRNGH